LYSSFVGKEEPSGAGANEVIARLRGLKFPGPLEIEVPGYLGIEKTHHVRMKKIDWTAAKIPVPNALAMTAVPLVSFVSTLGARYRAWYPPYPSRARPSFAGQKNR